MFIITSVHGKVLLAELQALKPLCNLSFTLYRSTVHFDNGYKGATEEDHLSTR